MNFIQSKEGKDHELNQSSATPDQRNHISESDKNSRKDHTKVHTTHNTGAIEIQQSNCGGL